MVGLLVAAIRNQRFLTSKVQNIVISLVHSLRQSVSYLSVGLR